MGYLVADDEEVKVRTQIWTELNKDYLEILEQKKRDEEVSYNLLSVVNLTY